MSRRNLNLAIRYQIVYWRDIPAQIKIRDGRKRKGRPLSDRFGQAIDQAAMLAGLTGSDDYLAQWHTTEWQEYDGDAETLAETLAAELEEAYSFDRLNTVAKNGGFEDK